MRIVAGIYGGRKFHPPSNIPTRPTTDFARTGLFNILNNEFDFAEISVLDLFAGTGALSFEMASRGCTDITSVDQNQKCTSFIERTAAEWGIEGLKVIKADAFSFLDRAHRTYDIILADPPYEIPRVAELPTRIFDLDILNANGWFVLETSPKHSFTSHPHFIKHRNYGHTHFHFFKK